MTLDSIGARCSSRVISFLSAVWRLFLPFIDRTRPLYYNGIIKT